MSTDPISRIEEIAAEWHFRRDSGEWTGEDQRALDEWLATSVRNRMAWLRLEHIWEESARLKVLGAGDQADLLPPPGRWNFTHFFVSSGSFQSPDIEPAVPHRGSRSAEAEHVSTHQRGSGPVVDRGSGELRPDRRGPGVRVRLAVAMTTLLVLAAGLLVAKGGLFGDRYATPVGGLELVPTPDGSYITLNTDSSIQVEVNDKQRLIELNRGEAYFEVAHDPKRAFIVTAGKQRVIAVGTKFSVQRKADDEIQIVVTEGKVRVERDMDSVAHPEFLVSGNIAKANDNGVLVRHTSVTEAEDELSWRAGILMFRDQTLADTIAQFNRYNSRKVIVADPRIADLRIEGNFRAKNVDAFVRLLESAFPIRVTEDQSLIVLHSK